MEGLFVNHLGAIKCERLWRKVVSESEKSHIVASDNEEGEMNIREIAEEASISSETSRKQRSIKAEKYFVCIFETTLDSSSSERNRKDSEVAQLIHGQLLATIDDKELQLEKFKSPLQTRSSQEAIKKDIKTPLPDWVSSDLNGKKK